MTDGVGGQGGVANLSAAQRLLVVRMTKDVMQRERALDRILRRHARYPFTVKPVLARRVLP